MDKKTSKLSIIRKYWKNTPEFFSEKYQNSFIQLLSPVNAFLLARRRKALQFAQNVKGKKVLDVGCGHGIFMIDFIKKGAYVVGIDYSPKMIELAKKELNSHQIPPNKYTLLVADATKLPFKDRKFDLILATGLTDYLTDKENTFFIKEAARVLKKDGKIIVSFPSKRSLFAFVRSGVGLTIRQKLFKLPPIHNQFTLDRIRKLLNSVGLKDVKRTKIFTTMWIIQARFK